MKLLRCPYHKLEEYKGHENSRIMNDETEEKGPFLTSYEFLAKKKKKRRRRPPHQWKQSHHMEVGQ